jgi:hypothetical protein
VTTTPLKAFFPGVVDTGQKYPKSLKFIAGNNNTAEKLFTGVPLMSALFFHRPPIYERATDHKYTNGCSHLGKKRGWDQV